MIRILIVDEEKTVREKLKTVLATHFEVIGTLIDGCDAIALCGDLQPDLILISVETAYSEGFKAIKFIVRQYPQIKVIILTSQKCEALIDRCFNAGAAGYLLKNMAATEIIEKIRFVFETSTNIDLVKPTKTNNPLQFSILSNSPQQKIGSLSIATPNEFLPPIGNWLLLSGLACLSIFIGAIALSSKLEYKVTVKAPATIRPIGELRLVQAATAGKISSLLVSENQQVRSQEIIARIDDTALQSQKRQLLANIQQIEQQLIQLNNQIFSLETQIIAQQNLQQRNQASAKAQLRHQQHLYRERAIVSQATVREAQATVELAKEELNRYRELIQTGIISQLQLQEKKAALKSSIARLEQMQASLNPSLGEIEIAREQIAQEKARSQVTLASLEQEKKQLNERKSEILERLNNYREDLNQVARELKNTSIRTPISGTIQVFNLRNQGQIVQSGDEIATIAPIDSSLKIKAAVLSSEIDRIKIGQKAQMQVSACPYADFGTLSGKVTAISPDTKAQQPEDISLTDSSYQISIQPENLELNTGDRSCQIRSGMQGKIDIITQEKTVLQFLLGKAKLL